MAAPLGPTMTLPASLALDLLEHDCVTANGNHLAALDPDASAEPEEEKPLAVGQRAAVTLEAKTRQGDVVGVVGRRQRTILCHDDTGRAGHSYEVNASGELKMARPVDTGRKHQWDARAAGRLDGPLQDLGLVIRTSGLDPEVDGIDAERRDRGHRSRSTRRANRRRARIGERARGKRQGEQMAAVEVHAERT